MADRSAEYILVSDVVDLATCDAAFLEHWHALYARDPHASVFLSPRYHLSFRQAGLATFAVTARRGSDLVGLLPIRLVLCQNAEAGHVQTDIKMPGTALWADYCGFLADPLLDEAVARAIADALIAEGWASLAMANWDASETRKRAFLSAFAGSDYVVRDVSIKTPDGSADNLICPRLDLPESFDSYLATLGKNMRQKLRRLLRQVEDHGISIRRGGAGDISAIVALWSARWGAEKRDQLPRLTRELEFILRAATNSQDMSITLAEQDGRITGGLCHYIDPFRKQALFFLGVRDMNTPELNVGLTLHAHCIREFIERGFVRYDFLRGDEDYKFKLGGIAHPITFTMIERRGSLGSVLNARALPEILARIPDLIDENNLNAAKVLALQAAAVLNA